MNPAEITRFITNRADLSRSSWRDSLGIIASIGCAIHCAAMPFVIAYLPALGLSFLADEGFHKWMALVCFLIAIVAFIPGLRMHRNWLPVSIGGVGLIFITFAAFGLAGECCPSCEAASGPGIAAGTPAGEATTPDDGCQACEECDSCSDSASEVTLGISSVDEERDMLAKLAPWITPFGGLLLVSAHLLNRRFGCLCGCCENTAATP